MQDRKSNTNNMQNRIVIIGSGQAGAMAAIYLRKKKFVGTIRIFGEEKYLPYQRPPLSKGFLSNEMYLSMNKPYNKNKNMSNSVLEQALLEAKQLEEAVKSSVFLIPLGNNLYKVGATYNNQDKDPHPSEEAREELENKLAKLINCKFEIVDQSAGIRPASKDRKPMLGRHPEYKNLYCCNGFGSRGVLISPSVSEQLIELAENDVQLPSEIDLQRFSKLTRSEHPKHS